MTVPPYPQTPETQPYRRRKSYPTLWRTPLVLPWWAWSLRSWVHSGTVLVESWWILFLPRLPERPGRWCKTRPQALTANGMARRLKGTSGTRQHQTMSCLWDPCQPVSNQRLTWCLRNRLAYKSKRMLVIKSRGLRGPAQGPQVCLQGCYFSIALFALRLGPGVTPDT